MFCSDRSLLIAAKGKRGSEMSTGRQTLKDLAEEAKKRAVLLLICVFGLSYLMSLTSSSVWVNMPAAVALIIFCRYISLDLDARRRTAACNKSSLVDQSTLKKSFELDKFPLEKPDWKRKVNSPPVEAAIEQFTRHLISEWVTDLWYSRITPDRDGPEELVQIMNNVLGEISSRARDINIINLLTRDIINLICNHLELHRSSQSKIKEDLGKLPIDHQDTQLRLVLAADNKLHPALFSAEAEHKVLQHLMNGLILVAFKPEDLQCSFFRYTIRELLACAVFRPVLNLANPRFINEKIESLVLSFANKTDKGSTPLAEETPIDKPPPKPSADQFSGFQDRSTVGVELVQVRQDRSKIASDEHITSSANGMIFQKDLNNSGNAKMNESCKSGAEWAQMLEIVSRRKTQVLAPENLENMWTRGRNYKKKERANRAAKQVAHGAFVGNSDTSQHPSAPSNYLTNDVTGNFNVSKRSTGSPYNADGYSVGNLSMHTDYNGSDHQPLMSYQETAERHDNEDVEPDSGSSYQSEDDESNNVTGLDSPGTRVWDSKNKRNAAASHIRHPLETSEFHLAKKNAKGHIRHPRTIRTSTGIKKSRSRNTRVPIWQEVERTSFTLGEGQSILQESKNDPKEEEWSDDPDMEIWGRVHSGAAASSSLSSISTSESFTSLRSPENSVLADSFLKLRCEVLAANIVKSGLGTFAVYCIAVTDANNNSWSIKRRYRHFEELHRRLKEFPEYNLHLPPKHFLSSGLDVPVVQERCKLLDKYLKMLLQLPTISGAIEVWDFLSVDSQTYMFSDSLSIIQTLSVNLDDKPYERNTKGHNSSENVNHQLLSSGQHLNSASKDCAMQINKNHPESDSLGLRKRNMEQHSGVSPRKELRSTYQDNSRGDPDSTHQENVLSSGKSEKPKKAGESRAGVMQETSPILESADDSTIPTEWVPPNLSVPILNLVDVVFQLQDGGWIRRQVFWVAKQILQLGMGDAFDDWLIEKIQLLRSGSVIASAINRVEKILWPDGIFLTKHPNRKPATPVNSAGSPKNHKVQNLTPEQQLEAAHRAKFVYELIIDKAPTALVGLVGRKEYERCAKDIYFFLQSPVCLKQLAFELLELLLLAAFPELDDVVRQCHEEKEQFGVLQDDR